MFILFEFLEKNLNNMDGDVKRVVLAKNFQKNIENNCKIQMRGFVRCLLRCVNEL